MNKKELVVACAEKTRDYQYIAETYVDAVLESITEALASGDDVRIKGFGKFEVKNRKEKLGRNPQSPKDTCAVPAKKAVKFTAGMDFKNAVNKN